MGEKVPVMMKLDFNDIEPMEHEPERCYRIFSGGLKYKGASWK